MELEEALFERFCRVAISSEVVTKIAGRQDINRR
jgi:hypothetical protein